MKKIKKLAKIMDMLLVSAVLVFCLTGCDGQKQQTQNGAQDETQSEVSDIAGAQNETQETLTEEVGETEENTEMVDDSRETNSKEETKSKVLVAYFSATGTTKKLAEYAAEVMGADLYEIVPKEPYTSADLDWNDSSSRTSIEMNDKSIKPAIDGSVADMAQYEIVFIAYPIWWGDAPHIMDTFMESYDFSGKTIVPFCTSGSSGIGSSAKELHDYTDESVTWLDGDRLSGSLSKEDMADWIRGLSLEIDENEKAVSTREGGK